MFHHTFEIPSTHVDHDTCHLFEHLVIRTFRDVLEQNGFYVGFAGEIDATTSNDTITFKLDTPHEEVISLFETHLKTLKSFDKTLIDHEVLRIGAEDDEVYTITDDKILLESLEDLIRQAAGDKNANNTQSSMVLSHSDTSNYFRESTIVFSLKDSPATLSRLFTDTHSIVLDIVYEQLVKTYPVYTLDVSSVILSDDGTRTGFAWQFRYPTHLSLDDIISDVQHTLKYFSIEKYVDQYSLYIKAIDSGLIANPSLFEDVIHMINVDEI